MAGSKYSGYSTDQLLQILLGQLGVTPTSGYSTDQLLQQLLAILLSSGSGGGGIGPGAIFTGPESDPHVVGEIYRSGDFLLVSNG
jgi:hypothetical protein